MLTSKHTSLARKSPPDKGDLGGLKRWLAVFKSPNPLYQGGLKGLTQFLRWILVWALGFTLFFAIPNAQAANVDGIHNDAWAENYGWLDAGSFTVSPTQITQDATGTGANAMTFHADSTYYVKVHPSQGKAALSGWAWGDAVGWIKMSSSTLSDNTQTGAVVILPASQDEDNFGVYVDENGLFRGYAWSDTGGWISFYENINTEGYTATTWRANLAPNTPTLDNYNDTGGWTFDTTPDLQFDLSDPDAGDQIKYQIQIDNNNDFGSLQADITEASYSATPRNNVIYTPSALTEGVWYWRVRAIDDDGSESAWATASNGFGIDITDPTAGNLSYLNDYQTDTTVEITVNYGSDTPSGLSAVDSDYLLEYKSATLTNYVCGSYGSWTDAGINEVANSPSYDYTGSFDQCYQFRYTVKDKAGNPKIYPSTDTIMLVDNIFPDTPTIDNYNTNSVTGDNTPTLQFDLSDPDAGDLIKYQIQIDNNVNFGSPEADVTEGNYTATPRNDVNYTTDTLVDSRWFWRVRAIDDDGIAGAWASATNGFRVDTTRPHSTILYPSDGANLKLVTRIVGESTDETAVNYTRISIYDSDLNKYYSGSAFVDDTETWLTTSGATVAAYTRWEYTAPAWTDGHSYTIRSRAMDTAWNEEHTDSITFTYDTVNGKTGSIYISDPSIMTNADYKVYYPNLGSIPNGSYIIIDFPQEFTFKPWLTSADITVTDSKNGITAASAIFDRVNRTITVTITGGSIPADDLTTIEISNLRIHNPSAGGAYDLPIQVYNNLDILVDEGTGEMVIANPYKQLSLNVQIEDSLQLSVNSGSVALNVDPDMQLGQNWVGTGGTVSDKTDVTVKTNAKNGYSLFIKLNGLTSTGSAVLDAQTLTGHTIASQSGSRVTTENNFTFKLNDADASFVDAFLPSSTAVSGAGTNAPTNSYIDTIYYFLNINYLTPADVYHGTITYTAVGGF